MEARDPERPRRESIVLDPWGLGSALCAQWRVRALLVSPRRALTRALGLAMALELDADSSSARGALDAEFSMAPRSPRTADIPERVSIRGVLDRALEESIQEQRDAELRGDRIQGTTDEAFYRWTARLLGLPCSQARLACVLVNRQPEFLRHRMIRHPSRAPWNRGMGGAVDCGEREAWAGVDAARKRGTQGAWDSSLARHPDVILCLTPVRDGTSPS